MSNNSTVQQPADDTPLMLKIKASRNTAKVIEDAIILSELSLGSSKTIKDINPVDEMSTDIGIALGYLISNSNESPTFSDWDFDMYGWKSFIMEILVLLGKPGVLDQLWESERATASLKARRLYDFFQEIHENKNTKHWLDWIAISQFGGDQEEDQKVNEYYDFSKLKAKHSFFSRFSPEEIEQMQKVLPELQKCS